MKTLMVAGLALICTNASLHAAELAKSYSYFSVRGNTLEELERDMSRRGPAVASTGQRHPGATRMEFTTKLTYADRGNSCTISAARVRVTAKVILPRWKPGRKATADTRFIWDTLAADIKRHEEAHVQIAKRYSRELEQALLGIGRQKDCARAGAKAAATSKRILDRHDREQQRFDSIEAAGFEKRLLRLMEARMSRMKAG